MTGTAPRVLTASCNEVRNAGVATPCVLPSVPTACDSGCMEQPHPRPLIDLTGLSEANSVSDGGPHSDIVELLNMQHAEVEGALSLGQRRSLALRLIRA
jgi:hypothetical protein